ncbi:MAG: hypothetical protein ACJ766_17680 [Thermoleophilaceae bacterium]
MSALAVGLILAVLASLALNGSFLLQHMGALDAPAISPLRPIATIRGLLGSPRWTAGLALGVTGWAMHVAALDRAPLSLVQAFVAGGLALTVPAGSRWLGHQLTRTEAAAVLVMAAGLVALSLGTHGATEVSHFHNVSLALFLAAAGALAAALVIVRLPRVGRPEALGAAGGVLYGVADVAIKVLTGLQGVGSVLRSPWLEVAAVATLGAFFCFQRGLQIGRAVPVIALMTAGTYVISIAAGLAILGEPLGSGAAAALRLAAFAVVVACAIVLARAQAALASSALGSPAAEGRVAPLGDRVESAPVAGQR